MFVWNLCSNPARADNRVIVRTTLGLQALQAFCNGLPLLQNCTVVARFDGALGQLFLVTTPLDLTSFLNLLSSTVGIVDAEADQLLNLVGGLSLVGTPPAGLSDTTPVQYSGSTVWDGYVNQHGFFIWPRPRIQPRMVPGELVLVACILFWIGLLNSRKGQQCRPRLLLACSAVLLATLCASCGGGAVTGSPSKWATRGNSGWYLHYRRHRNFR